MACSFSTVGCPAGPPRSLWFRFGAHRTETLCVDGCTSEADKFTVRTDLAQNQVSLTVNRLTPNDSAIYVCGLAAPSSEDPGAKQAGAGTVLVVRGQWSRLGSSTPHAARPSPQLCASVPCQGRPCPSTGQRTVVGKPLGAPLRAPQPAVCRCPASPHAPMSLVRATFLAWR